MVRRESHSSHGDSFSQQWLAMWQHPQPSLEQRKAITRLGLHQPGVMPLGGKSILGWITQRKHGICLFQDFFSFLQMYFIPEAEVTLQTHLLTPTNISSYCIPKKITSFRSRKALLYSFCIYIVHYSGSWVEKRALLCIFVLAIVYAGLTEWGNSGYHFNFWCQHQITYLISCLAKHCIATRRIISLHLLCCVFAAIGLPSNWQL